MAVELTWASGAIDRTIGGFVQTDLLKRGNRAKAIAQRLVPVRDGKLRASIHVTMQRRGSSWVCRVGSNLNYARAVHDGTGIYGPRKAPIRPRTGQFLRWPATNTGGGNRRYSGGKTQRYVYARQVKGQPGKQYLTLALKQTMATGAG